MDNRHGLIVDTRTTQASGRAERESVLAMIEARPGKGRLTVGADKGYDTRDFVEGLRWANVSPHVAQNDTHRRSAIDRRTTRHAGYAQSQRVRKRIEEAFGWAKTVGGLRKLKHRGTTEGGLSVHPDLRGLQPGAAAYTWESAHDHASCGVVRLHHDRWA